MSLQETITTRNVVIEGRKRQVEAISAKRLVAVGYTEDLHRHDEAQLLLVVRGMATFDVGKSRWLVSPQSAIWIPAGVEHCMSSTGEVELHCLYLKCSFLDLPFSGTRALNVPPLMRELIFEMSNLPERINVNGPHARLTRALIDQLARTPVGPRQVAMPEHPKLRGVADALIVDPSDRRTVSEWAKAIGMSERTFQRSFLQETGMSFGVWRRQVHILLALQRLGEGDSVQTVAYFLGYDSPSAFTEMFRKTLGKPPMKFLTEY